LSKALLPHTLSALYFYVDLDDLLTVVKFAAALIQRPQLIKAVVLLRLEADEMDLDGLGWDVGAVGKGVFGDALEQRRAGIRILLSSRLHWKLR
jgi:hypothetical protein